MSAQKIDWQAAVERYETVGFRQAEAVREAKIQAQRLDGADFWEAVHTLARQAVGNAGGKGGESQ